jgi:hypothetical protein
VSLTRIFHGLDHLVSVGVLIPRGRESGMWV